MTSFDSIQLHGCAVALHTGMSKIAPLQTLTIRHSHKATQCCRLRLYAVPRQYIFAALQVDALPGCVDSYRSVQHDLSLQHTGNQPYGTSVIQPGTDPQAQLPALTHTRMSWYRSMH